MKASFPQEQRYYLKIAQCEANIRRFDAHNRDTPKRNYWWRQSQKWRLKLHPELKGPWHFYDFETSPQLKEGWKETTELLSYLHTAFTGSQ